jgi:ribonuclease HII
MDLWAFEKTAGQNGFTAIAGVDEAGRGPLAGPVVSAAVILPQKADVPGIKDSKKLTPRRRSILYKQICDCATAVGIGVVGPERIDRINILQASLLSMLLSVECLEPQPDYLLIDGIYKIQIPLPQYPITKGDSRSISISAASIVAKVTRDRLMSIYDNVYPQYGFSKHKGYPTKAHKESIRTFGSSAIHRKSFKGVKEKHHESAAENR